MYSGRGKTPFSQYAAVIPRFITAMLNYSSPIMYGDGQQSRDFTFVKHVVDANVLACESEETGAFNIACGRSISINQLVALIGEITGKTIEAQHAAPRLGDVKHSLADISKARSFGTSLRAPSKTSLKQLSGGLKMDLGLAIKDKSARIAVIGMGYVGLPTAVNFAENGFDVICVSRSRDKVSAINQGSCYLKDLNIDERVARLVRRKKLTATTDTTEATEEKRCNRHHGANADYSR